MCSSDLAGADKLDGGLGINTLSYGNDTAGVSVNLAAGSASGGDAAGDTIASFANVIGGGGNDALTGDGGANWLFGGAGDDTLAGGAGADSLDGGIGTNTLSYGSDTAGVSADLGTGAVSGGDASGDTIANFANVLGGSGNDALSGNGSANRLSGDAGNDTLAGGLGDDTLDGGANDDLLTGGAGNDSLAGGAGNDTAAFSGNRSVYTLTSTGGSVVVTGPADGSDTLSGIEYLQFTDGTIAIPPVVSIAGAVSSAAEGNSGTTSLTFSVTLDRASANTESVSYAVTGTEIGRAHV